MAVENLQYFVNAEDEESARVVKSDHFSLSGIDMGRPEPLIVPRCGAVHLWVGT